jgi:hypothetical protein
MYECLDGRVKVGAFVGSWERDAPSAKWQIFGRTRLLKTTMIIRNGQHLPIHESYLCNKT